MTEVSLEDIKKSLEPKPTAKAQVKKTTEAIDLATALLKLPEISKQLASLAAETKREVDLLSCFERIDLDVQSLIGKAERNLTQIDAVDKKLEARIKQIDQFEAKYHAIMDRVANVLDDLERITKKY